MLLANYRTVPFSGATRPLNEPGSVRRVPVIVLQLVAGRSVALGYSAQPPLRPYNANNTSAIRLAVACPSAQFVASSLQHSRECSLLLWGGCSLGASLGSVDQPGPRLILTGVIDIGMLPRETDGTAPMYFPVRVFCSVQPEPDDVTIQLSVPWPMSTTLLPSVRHAPLSTLQMVKAPPETANLNCCQGFG